MLIILITKLEKCCTLKFIYELGFGCKAWAQICDKIFRIIKIYSFKAYFELNLDPGPKCKLKMGFFNF